MKAMRTGKLDEKSGSVDSISSFCRRPLAIAGSVDARMNAARHGLRKAPKWIGSLLPWLAVLLLSILYGTTLSPFALPGDSAEFVTAAVTLGVCHPTGYPLYVLLGKLATSILFFLPATQVVNGLSALYCILALIMIIASQRLLRVSPLCTAVSIAVLGISPSVWRYSTVAEVYTLHALLFSIVIYLVISCSQAPSPRKFCLLAFVAGASLGNHMTSALALPGLIVWFLVVMRRRAHQFRPYHVLGMASLFVLGISSLLLLALFDRENTYNYVAQYHFEFPHAPLETTSQRLLWLTSASQYKAGPGLAKHLFSTRLVKKSLRQFAAIMEHTPVLSVLGLAGLLLLAVHDGNRTIPQGFAAFFWMTLLGLVLFLATYLAFEPIFYVQAFVMFSFGVARLLDDLISDRSRAVLAAVIAMFCLAMALRNYATLDMSEFDRFENWAEAFLEKIEPDAIVCSNWPHSTLFWHQQYVKGNRPDVVVINAINENWLKLADHFPERPQYYESVPPGMTPSSFEMVEGFYKKIVIGRLPADQ